MEMRADPLLQQFHMEGLFLPDEQYDSYLGVPIRYGPGMVKDLTVVDRSATTLTVAWTQVDDGRGRPVRYAIRVLSPTIDEFTWGEASDTEVAVNTRLSIGAPRSVQLTGLTPGTAYGVMLVTYRGTRGQLPDWGSFSNAALASTV